MGQPELYKRIYQVVRQVPLGKVATYGQIAAIVGPPCEARTVGYAMAALRWPRAEPPVPWQRVINARGMVSTRGHDQQQILESEGVVFDERGRTDLARFGWQGPDPAWAQVHGFHVVPAVKKDDEDASQLTLF